MIETLSPKKELEDLQADLREVQELLRRHRLVEHLVERQEMPKHELVESLVHRQNVAELRAKLDSMHPADIAYVLESLPLEERLVVWNLVKAERDGEILLQASDAVRETLIRSMDLQELVAAAEQLEADEIADLAPDLPEGVIHDVFQALPVEEREQSALSWISTWSACARTPRSRPSRGICGASTRCRTIPIRSSSLTGTSA